MNTDWIDYYLALELEFGCSGEEIKKNYRDLMKKYHPDSKFADEVRAKEVNKAYEILGDPDKRAEYDATYLQYKNGEFQEESPEMPKYTYEEMHETFTEEEINFAKRVALQQTISETIENVKIIIDAKNELLFAAFNDAYDKDTYKSEFKQFHSITNEFIANLQDLICESEEFGLDAEIDTINQVIAFLIEVMEEIPKSLKEAKRKVKLEIMKEQLQEKAEQAISNAEDVREEFVSLYAKVYTENIGKDEFKMYYNILRLGLSDALSQLVELYDLLKKANLDETYKNVGILIGQLSQDLELYSGKYKVAQAIGKRLSLREKIKNSMLSFTEYKVKMLSIMQGIIDDPTLDNVKLRVVEGKTLTQSFQNGFSKFTKENFDDSKFADVAKSLYKDAANIYVKRTVLHNKLTKIFDKTKKERIELEYVELLKEEVETSQEEIEAIKLLHEVYILLGKHREYQEITDSELKKLIKTANKCIENSNKLQGYLESMLEYIEKTGEAYDAYCRYCQENDLDTLDSVDYASLGSMVERYQAISVLFNLLANFAAIGIIGHAFIFGDIEVVREFHIASETLNVPQVFINGVLAYLCSYVPLKTISTGYKAKSDGYTSKQLLYRKLISLEQSYKTLFDGTDLNLQDIYQKALKIK